MEEGAAITRTYFMKGVWFWHPVWEEIGESERYPSQHLWPPLALLAGALKGNG
jgi:hypothetical protein